MLVTSQNKTIIEDHFDHNLTLENLLERKGKVVTRDELFDLAWGRDYMPNSRALDQYVSSLRRKIEIDPARPRIVSTVHGAGYRYDG